MIHYSEVLNRLFGKRRMVALGYKEARSWAMAVVLMWPSGIMAADVELPRDFSITQGDASIYYESFTDNRSGGAGAPTELQYVGVLDIINGNVVFTGPTYQHQVFGHHTAMCENTRGLLLLHPRLSASESLATSVAFDVTESSRYRVTGRFARANDYRLAGDGVVVMVFVNEDTATPLMEAAISSDHLVDPDDPFSGTGTVEFDIEVLLDAGDSLRFAVFGGPIESIDGDFDVTAIELNITAPGIFSDGFESGDPSAWSAVAPNNPPHWVVEPPYHWWTPEGYAMDFSFQAADSDSWQVLSADYVCVDGVSGEPTTEPVLTVTGTNPVIVDFHWDTGHEDLGFYECEFKVTDDGYQSQGVIYFSDVIQVNPNARPFWLAIHSPEPVVGNPTCVPDFENWIFDCEMEDGEAFRTEIWVDDGDQTPDGFFYDHVSPVYECYYSNDGTSWVASDCPQYELEVLNSQRPYKAYLTWHGDETHPFWHAVLRYTDDNPVNPRTTHPRNFQLFISML